MGSKDEFIWYNTNKIKMYDFSRGDQNRNNPETVSVAVKKKNYPLSPVKLRNI